MCKREKKRYREGKRGREKQPRGEGKKQRKENGGKGEGMNLNG